MGNLLSYKYYNIIINIKKKPLVRSFTVLYSNKKLIEKYNISPPKTWEELYNATNYIVEEERKANNTNIIGLTGLFDSNDK